MVRRRGIGGVTQEVQEDDLRERERDRERECASSRGESREVRDERQEARVGRRNDRKRVKVPECVAGGSRSGFDSRLAHPGQMASLPASLHSRSPATFLTSLPPTTAPFLPPPHLRECERMCADAGANATLASIHSALHEMPSLSPAAAVQSRPRVQTDGYHGCLPSSRSGFDSRHAHPGQMASLPASLHSRSPATFLTSLPPTTAPFLPPPHLRECERMCADAGANATLASIHSALHEMPSLSPAAAVQSRPRVQTEGESREVRDERQEARVGRRNDRKRVRCQSSRSGFDSRLAHPGQMASLPASLHSRSPATFLTSLPPTTAPFLPPPHLRECERMCADAGANATLASIHSALHEMPSLSPAAAVQSRPRVQTE
ncbi:hypothetical protein Aperf_G00000126628 [Anoplocephala perfoliata]